MRKPRKKVVEHFIEERCYCDSNEEILLKDLWDEFWKWSCRNNNGVSRGWFPLMLVELGFRKWHRGGRVYMQGLRIKEEE